MLSITYITLALLGCGYIAVSAFLGHVLDVGTDDAGHGLDAAGHPAFHFPLFSPMALATLAAATGGYGLIGKHGLELGDGASLALALPAALATAWAVTYVVYRIARSSRATSEIHTADLVGAPAEVITPIPAGGLGEVAAIVDGQRFTSAAREQDGVAVGRGQQVRVVKLLGGTMVVSARAEETR